MAVQKEQENGSDGQDRRKAAARKVSQDEKVARDGPGLPVLLGTVRVPGCRRGSLLPQAVQAAEVTQP